jgi:hypothetical protein
MKESAIISMYKSGYFKRKELAELNKTATSNIQSILKGFPTTKQINRIKEYPDFKEFFVSTYNSTDSISDILTKLKAHPYFNRVTNSSMYNRVNELRKLLDLEVKMFEQNYESKYDRIKGYIIRNSKFMSKRRGIFFNITYNDFELPTRCPLLNIELSYGAGNDGNAYNHATLDRIDNNQGYIPGNVWVISRLANAMKNQANFNQLKTFSENIITLIDYLSKEGALGNITDIFPHWEKLSLDS